MARDELRNIRDIGKAYEKIADKIDRIVKDSKKTTNSQKEQKKLLEEIGNSLGQQTQDIKKANKALDKQKKNYKQQIDDEKELSTLQKLRTEKLEGIEELERSVNDNLDERIKLSGELLNLSNKDYKSKLKNLESQKLDIVLTEKKIDIQKDSLKVAAELGKISQSDYKEKLKYLEKQKLDISLSEDKIEIQKDIIKSQIELTSLSNKEYIKKLKIIEKQKLGNSLFESRIESQKNSIKVESELEKLSQKVYKEKLKTIERQKLSNSLSESKIEEEKNSLKLGIKSGKLSQGDYRNKLKSLEIQKINNSLLEKKIDIQEDSIKLQVKLNQPLDITNLRMEMINDNLKKEVQFREEIIDVSKEAYKSVENMGDIQKKNLLHITKRNALEQAYYDKTLSKYPEFLKKSHAKTMAWYKTASSRPYKGVMDDVVNGYSEISSMVGLNGDFAKMFGLAGMLAALGSLDQKMADFRKEIIRSTAASGEFWSTLAKGKSADQLKGQIDNLRFSMDNLYSTFGVNKEQMQEAISAGTAAGLKLTEMTGNFEKVDKGSASLIKLTREGEYTMRAMEGLAVSAIMTGKDLSEVSNIAGDWQMQFGTALGEVQGMFAQLQSDAEGAGLTTNKFMDRVMQASSGLGIYGGSITDVSREFRNLAGSMALPKEAAADLTAQLMEGTKGKSTGEKLGIASLIDAKSRLNLLLKEDKEKRTAISEDIIKTQEDIDSASTEEEKKKYENVLKAQKMELKTIDEREKRIKKIQKLEGPAGKIRAVEELTAAGKGAEISFALAASKTKMENVGGASQKDLIKHLQKEIASGNEVLIREVAASQGIDGGEFIKMVEGIDVEKVGHDFAKEMDAKWKMMAGQGKQARTAADLQKSVLERIEKVLNQYEPYLKTMAIGVGALYAGSKLMSGIKEFKKTGKITDIIKGSLFGSTGKVEEKQLTELKKIRMALTGTGTSQDTGYEGGDGPDRKSKKTTKKTTKKTYRDLKTRKIKSVKRSYRKGEHDIRKAAIKDKLKLRDVKKSKWGYKTKHGIKKFGKNIKSGGSSALTKVKGYRSSIAKRVKGSGIVKKGTSMLAKIMNFGGKNVTKLATKGKTGAGIAKGLGMGANALKSAPKIFKNALGKMAKVIKIPLASAVIDFGANMLSGKSVGESAGRAAGSGVGSLIGGAIGSLIAPGVGTVIGAAVGGWLGDQGAGMLMDELESNPGLRKGIVKGVNILAGPWIGDWVENQLKVFPKTLDEIGTDLSKASKGEIASYKSIQKLEKKMKDKTIKNSREIYKQLQQKKEEYKQYLKTKEILVKMEKAVKESNDTLAETLNSQLKMLGFRKKANNANDAKTKKILKKEIDNLLAKQKTDEGLGIDEERSLKIKQEQLKSLNEMTKAEESAIKTIKDEKAGKLDSKGKEIKATEEQKTLAKDYYDKKSIVIVDKIYTSLDSAFEKTGTEISKGKLEDIYNEAAKIFVIDPKKGREYLNKELKDKGFFGKGKFDSPEKQGQLVESIESNIKAGKDFDFKNIKDVVIDGITIGLKNVTGPLSKGIKDAVAETGKKTRDESLNILKGYKTAQGGTGKDLTTYKDLDKAEQVTSAVKEHALGIFRNIEKSTKYDSKERDEALKSQLGEKGLKEMKNLGYNISDFILMSERLSKGEKLSKQDEIVKGLMKIYEYDKDKEKAILTGGEEEYSKYSQGKWYLGGAGSGKKEANILSMSKEQNKLSGQEDRNIQAGKSAIKFATTKPVEIIKDKDGNPKLSKSGMKSPEKITKDGLIELHKGEAILPSIDRIMELFSASTKISPSIATIGGTGIKNELLKNADTSQLKILDSFLNKALDIIENTNPDDLKKAAKAIGDGLSQGFSGITQKLQKGNISGAASSASTMVDETLEGEGAIKKVKDFAEKFIPKSVVENISSKIKEFIPEKTIKTLKSASSGLKKISEVTKGLDPKSLKKVGKELVNLIPLDKFKEAKKDLDSGDPKGLSKGLKLVSKTFSKGNIEKGSKILKDNLSPQIVEGVTKIAEKTGLGDIAEKISTTAKKLSTPEGMDSMLDEQISSTVESGDLGETGGKMLEGAGEIVKSIGGVSKTVMLGYKTYKAVTSDAPVTEGIQKNFDFKDVGGMIGDWVGSWVPGIGSKLGSVIGNKLGELADNLVSDEDMKPFWNFIQKGIDWTKDLFSSDEDSTESKPKSPPQRYEGGPLDGKLVETVPKPMIIDDENSKKLEKLGKDSLPQVPVNNNVTIHVNQNDLKTVETVVRKELTALPLGR